MVWSCTWEPTSARKMALLCCYKAATSDQTGWHTDHFLEENYKAGCTHWSTGSFCSCVRRHWQTQIRAEHRVCLPDNYVVLTQWSTKRNIYISADRQVRQPRTKAKWEQKTGSVLPFCKSKLIRKSSFQRLSEHWSSAWTLLRGCLPSKRKAQCAHQM